LQFETISLPEELALPVSDDLGGAAKPKIIVDGTVDYQRFFPNDALYNARCETLRDESKNVSAARVHLK
jgi:hypothetical protein